MTALPKMRVTGRAIGIFCKSTNDEILWNMNIIHMYIDIFAFSSMISLIKLTRISIR